MASSNKLPINPSSAQGCAASFLAKMTDTLCQQAAGSKNVATFCDNFNLVSGSKTQSNKIKTTMLIMNQISQDHLIKKKHIKQTSIDAMLKRIPKNESSLSIK